MNQPRLDSNKRCFVYCGDDRCTCDACRPSFTDQLAVNTTKHGGLFEFLNKLRDICHKRSVDAGWWNEANKDRFGGISSEGNENLFATKIALIHSEASEMLEGLRKGLPDDHLPLRSMEEVEAADILIRLFDYAGARNLDLAGALYEKMDYNQVRPDHTPEARAAEGGKTF